MFDQHNVNLIWLHYYIIYKAAIWKSNLNPVDASTESQICYFEYYLYLSNKK